MIKPLGRPQRMRRCVGAGIASTVLALALPEAWAAPKGEAELFPSEAEAERRCPGDLVVWVDPATRTYHFRGQRWYGSTAKGGYACKKAAEAQGYRRNPSGK
jgi:hypothetical protein